MANCLKCNDTGIYESPHDKMLDENWKGNPSEYRPWRYPCTCKSSPPTLKPDASLKKQ